MSGILASNETGMVLQRKDLDLTRVWQKTLFDKNRRSPVVGLLFVGVGVPEQITIAPRAGRDL